MFCMEFEVGVMVSFSARITTFYGLKKPRNSASSDIVSHLTTIVLRSMSK